MKKFLEKSWGFLKKNWKMAVLALSILVGIGIDQLTKLIVAGNMRVGQSIVVIEGIFNITYIRNNGAAFGMLADHPWVFNTLSVVSVLAILVYLFGFCKEGWLFQTGFALIIGGGIGNMIDRIAYGYVVDMLEFDFMEFAIFNVADSFVCIGAGLVMLMLVLELVRESKKGKEKEISVVLEQEENNDNN